MSVWKCLLTQILLASLLFLPVSGTANQPLSKWAKVCAKALSTFLDERDLQRTRRNSARLDKLAELVVLDGSRLAHSRFDCSLQSDSMQRARKEFERLGQAGILAQFFGNPKMTEIARQRHNVSYGLRQVAHRGTVSDLSRLNAFSRDIPHVLGAENLPSILELIHQARFTVAKYQKLFELYVPPPFDDGPLCFVRREHVWRELSALVHDARQELTERHLRLDGVNLYHLRRRIPRLNLPGKMEMTEALKHQVEIDPDLAAYVAELSAKLGERYAPK